MPNFRPPAREHRARVHHSPCNGWPTTALILLAAFAVGAPVTGQQDPASPGALSRADAIQEALAHHPALLASREQIEQARAQVVQATALADPSLSATTLGQTKALRVGSRAEVDLALGLTLPFPGRTGLRRSVATADLHSAELALTQLQQQIASQAVEAYDGLLVAMRHAEDLEQSKQFAADFLDKTRARFAGGTVAKVDVLKAQVDLAQAQNDLIANQRDTASARATLNRLLGRPGGTPLTTSDALTPPADLPALELLEQLASASRPELRSLTAQQAGAKAASQLARRFWLPDFSLSAGRNAVQGEPATFTTGLAIGFPIFFWQHQKGEIATANHREQELAADLVDQSAQVSLDVRTNYAAAATALEQAVFIRDELLPQAHEVYRVAALSYGLGGSSALELLDAKRTLLDAENQYAEALGAANDARATLELAVGAPLPLPVSGAHP
ncbi:MAG: TolC family protein [Acidobacteriota bacterium]